MKIDLYMKIIISIIAICLIKIAFFLPPQYLYAQFPFLSSSDKPVDVNIKAIDDNEIVFSRDGELYIGGKKGTKLIENGAWIVRIKKE